MSGNNNAPQNCSDKGGLIAILSCGSGVASNNSGETANSLFYAIGVAIASSGVQLLVFLILRLRLSRIYRPRSYLVPERERVAPPPRGLFGWLKPLFTTPNLSFIQKCGLDAYFFLRYLRLLLKIFVPLMALILPILLPINRYSGTNPGLDKLSISNISPHHTGHRLWAHLVLALVVIVWVCYVSFRELRGYIRVRQAFLTSPQHRIRASATTVLVTGIPRKWLTVEALNGLYDVFPGGIRNIWINRNFDELDDKVSYRAKIAKGLEDAESKLVKMCWTKNHKTEEERRKKEGAVKRTKQERKVEQTAADAEAANIADSGGVSSDYQHEPNHGLQDALDEAQEAEDKRDGLESNKNRGAFGFVGQGFDVVGRGVGKIQRNVDAGFHKAADTWDNQVQAANLGTGFVTDEELFRRSKLSLNSVPPTPPPKSPPAARTGRMQAQREAAMDGISAADYAPAREPLPAARPTPMAAGPLGDTPLDDQSQGPPYIRTTGPSIESKPRSMMQIEEPDAHKASHPMWKVWKHGDKSLAMPSPQPHTAEADEYPLASNAMVPGQASPHGEKAKEDVSGSKLVEKIAFWKSHDGEIKEDYPQAFRSDLDEDVDGEPYWRRYLEPKERETMRVPILSPTWCPSLPLIGKKVDRIYWLRRELARMNLEIELDQSEPEKYPFMNSAFIQFNHQVAAHMACQSLSHHVPQHMAPRLVEISPEDVIWGNLSIKWWERYLRTGLVLVVSAGLIIFYAVPVTFTSLLSKISTLARFGPFHWLNDIPDQVISIIQGVLPPIILGIILSLVPIIFRILVKQQGVPTGAGQELGVQQWYFAFLFIQVFLVVTITGGLVAFITVLANNPASIVSTLAQNLPKASNYFFSYLIIQAVSNSASALLQVGTLISWFVVAPLFDSTARAKWRRQTSLQRIQWGSFFPPFTNFAVIGIIYSVIAPLILPFMFVIFGLFWIVYRYNVLFVYQFRTDTGGLLFPTAVNQLFVGLYVMELCLIGFFFIARDANHDAVCIPQAIVMVVALICTVGFQWLLNSAFRPLFQYLPITLEDEAVIRDDEFARAQASKHAPLRSGDDERDIQDVAAERDEREDTYEDEAIEQERRQIDEHRRSRRQSGNMQEMLSPRRSVHDPSAQWSPSLHGRYSGAYGPNETSHTPGSRDSWHQRSRPTSDRETWKTDRWRQAAPQAASRIRNLARVPIANGHQQPAQENEPKEKDLEAQQKTVGDVLFSGFADELEDLTPDERDLLVRYAFQHSALRAKRPVVWIPRDKLGVSDDEIKRTKKMSTIEAINGEEGIRELKTNIWMSNEGTALDGKGKVVYRRSPPDFSNVDLIAL